MIRGTIAKRLFMFSESVIDSSITGGAFIPRGRRRGGAEALRGRQMSFVIFVDPKVPSLRRLHAPPTAVRPGPARAAELSFTARALGSISAAPLSNLDRFQHERL
ncbi:hypothetical protein EVAR_22800_1 [Eumeta japonica]|uniref:Uncharacterized protein n=1 Tax=Eumeta variegata TaxID=151549 RepID=A0A4C1VFH7_EUMVA|nr:hypothetical protein EVAR_22800_1 [Eumeta japonica]